MINKLVTAFIPSYNYAEYIEDAIESIINQTYPCWEIVVVDDASTDSSPETICKYQERYPDKIRAVFLTKNVGQAEATNIGIAHARGSYITFLAADDIARSNRFSEAVEILENYPDVGSVFSKVSFIDSEGRSFQPASDIFNREVYNLRWQLLEGNFLCGTSAVHRLDVIKSTGGYNRALSHVEDFDLWLRILDKFDIIRVPQVWVDYRVHDKNLSAIGSSGNEMRFGMFYETAITILGAIQRWPLESLFEFKFLPHSPERKYEEAMAKIKLSNHCLSLDKKFFGKPLICLGMAYRLALDAALLVPENEQVKELLNVIYLCMGDSQRARGQKSIKMSDLSVYWKIKTPLRWVKRQVVNFKSFARQ